MPSGAKKRKAAKKRKEIQPNNNANPSPAPTQGGGDVKPQDDRHSDVGEASSAASQDPSLHDNLTEGEEKIENGENVSNLPQVEGVKSEANNEHEVLLEGIDAPFDRGSKIEDEFDKKNGSFEHYETERKSYDGGSSGSSGSNSSDDESHGIKRNQAVVDTASFPVKVNHSLQVGVSEMCKDAASQQEEATIPSIGRITATLNPKACIEEETDDRLSLAYNSPIISLKNEADAEKDSGVIEPLLTPLPHPVETTSWKGCCGLFELFTGSGR